jgi:hypothetical protein
MVAGDEEKLPRVRPSSNVLFRVLDDEAVLLHLDTGVYFKLNAVATSSSRRCSRRSTSTPPRS